MPSPTVLCPCCGKRLVCSFPPEPGQSMRCHHCGRPFTVPGEKKTEAKVAPKPSRRIPTAAVGGIVGAAAFAVAGVVVALIYFGQPQPAPASAEVSPALTPTSQETRKDAAPPREIPRPVQGVTDINMEMEPPAAKKDDAPGAMPDMAALPEPAPLPKDGLIKDWLPKKEQAMVDNAVRRGVVFLKKSQLPDGSWAGGGHSVGATALGGLALLECGVPVNDVSIRRAANHLRKHVPTLNRTYETSLCILFFDRLRAAEDRPRIVTLSLRLLAGQQEDGGWSYTVPLLNRTEESNLLIALRLTRPQKSEDLFVRTGDIPLLELYLPKETTSKSLKMTLEEQNPTPTSGNVEIALSGVSSKPPAGADQAKPMIDVEGPPPPPAAPAEKAELPAKPEKRAPLPADVRRALDKLPGQLRQIPALPMVGGNVGAQGMVMDRRGRVFHRSTDNSNTQFAIIGLWAARRHLVPMDRALAQIVWRFHTSQHTDGSWTYHFTSQRQAGTGRATMTGAALIGLGVGYGLTLPNGAAREKGMPANPQLTDGLKWLGNSLENPQGVERGLVRFRRGADLYYWWTVERVAVLYGLRSFQGRPWYEAGVADILPNQDADGSWTYQLGAAGQPVGTSFALLFLKGSNLVSDLSKTIKGEPIKK